MVANVPTENNKWETHLLMESRVSVTVIIIKVITKFQELFLQKHRLKNVPLVGIFSNVSLPTLYLQLLYFKYNSNYQRLQ